MDSNDSFDDSLVINNNTNDFDELKIIEEDLKLYLTTLQNNFDNFEKVESLIVDLY
eukprot:Pgem_evm1s16321